MSDIQAVDENTFETEVIQETSLPVLVDFWADWCSPCRKLGPTLEQLAEELYGKLKIVKVNVREVNALTSQYGVMNIPTMIIFKNGEEVTRMTGNRPRQRLLAELEPYL